MGHVELGELTGKALEILLSGGLEGNRDGARGDSGTLTSGMHDICDLQPKGEIATNDHVVTKLTVKPGSS